MMPTMRKRRCVGKSKPGHGLREGDVVRVAMLGSPIRGLLFRVRWVAANSDCIEIIRGEQRLHAKAGCLDFVSRGKQVVVGKKLNGEPEFCPSGMMGRRSQAKAVSIRRLGNHDAEDFMKPHRVSLAPMDTGDFN